MVGSDREASVSLATAAASDQTVTMDGKEYRITPLTAKQWGELLRWVQARYVALAVQASAALPELERKEVFWIALREASVFSHTTPFFKSMIRSPEGTSRLLWMGIVPNHAEVKVEQVEKWIGSEETRLALMTVFNLANMGGEEDGEDGPKAGRPTTPA